MSVRVTDGPLPGVRLIEATRFDDARGWFAELWNAPRYRAAGLDVELVQCNVSYSQRGVLRGLHFQSPREQGKLISVVRGAVFDAIVDVRVGSPAFGQWFGWEMSAENGRQLWVPEGYAHGFLVLSDDALVQYGCTVPYDPAYDRTLAWDDADVDIRWPAQPALISDKDRVATGLAGLRAAGVLPAYAAAPAGRT